MCHSGQLAGLWAAEFLRLSDPPFVPERAQAALEAIGELRAANVGVMLGHAPPDRGHAPPERDHAQPDEKESEPKLDSRAWPELSMAYYNCLRIYRGDAAEVFEELRAFHDNCLSVHGRHFNRPLQWDSTKGEPSGWGQDRHMGALAIWHALYAIEGFFLSVPDRLMVVMPNLPDDSGRLEAPIFTPNCAGKLRYLSKDGDPYTQQVHVAFDSPVSIRFLELRVPSSIVSVNVHVDLEAEVDIQTALRDVAGSKILFIDFGAGSRALQSLGIKVEGTEG